MTHSDISTEQDLRKMAVSFENLDNTLRDWANEKVAEKSCRGIEQVREAERRKIKPFLL